MIEDMFSRLNEAVPLNAAEKRNAIGGELVAAIREVAGHEFFTRCVAFGNKRFQHREVAARFILVEENTRTLGKIIDTKKEYLDALARNYRHGKTGLVVDVQKTVTAVLDFMKSIFIEKDELLRAQGNMVLYYLLCKSAIHAGETENISRARLYKFRDAVRDNRVRAEENYAEASFELLEFDRLSQQGTNDSSNIRERLGVITRSMGVTAVTI